MNNLLFDLKLRFDKSLTELTNYLPLINLMVMMSHENNSSNGFGLFVQEVATINKNSLYYFDRTYYIYDIVVDAKLYLNDAELSRFDDYAKDSFGMQKERLKNAVDNFYRISLFEAEEIKKTPLGYADVLERAFAKNYDGADCSMPVVGMEPNESFPTDLVKGIENRFKQFEETIEKIKNPLEQKAKANSLSVPQKVKILDELNIKGWLQGKNYTTFQIEQLLSDLFEKTDKTIRSAFSNSNHKKIAENYLEDLKKLKAKRH